MEVPHNIKLIFIKKNAQINYLTYFYNIISYLFFSQWNKPSLEKMMTFKNRI